MAQDACETRTDRITTDDLSEETLRAGAKVLTALSNEKLDQMKEKYRDDEDPCKDLVIDDLISERKAITLLRVSIDNTMYARGTYQLKQPGLYEPER